MRRGGAFRDDDVPRLAFPEIGSLTDRCFAVAGAEDAERFLETSPLSEDQRHDVLDAICLHINPSVDRERGALQYLAHDGIALDVVGMRAWELDGAGTRRVFESHPRHSFNGLADTSMKPHGRRVPGCRHPVAVPDRVRAGAEAEPVGAVRKAIIAASGQPAKGGQLSKGLVVSIFGLLAIALIAAVRRRRRQHVDRPRR